MKVPEPRKLESGTWFIQLRLNGVSVPVSASTEKECRRAAELIKAEHRAGKRQIQKVKSDPTLRQAIDEYIKARSNTLSPATIRGYRYIQDGRFKSAMDKPIKSIKSWQPEINAEAKLCSAKTLKNAWGFVSSVLRENGIEHGPVSLPQVISKERPWLQPKEVAIFVAAVKGEKLEISALLALHGLRRSEILGLTWDKVDLDKKLIHVEGSAVVNYDGKLEQKNTNKNRTSRRTVPIMIPELQAALEAVQDKTGKVVDCSPNTMRSRINRICKNNGLPEVGVHGLRRSFASLGYHLKMSEREVMDLGGWADTQTMHKIYIKLAEADRAAAENKMAQFYKNANQNANGDSKSA